MKQCMVLLFSLNPQMTYFGMQDYLRNCDKLGDRPNIKLIFTEKEIKEFINNLKTLGCNNITYEDFNDHSFIVECNGDKVITINHKDI